jgi:hypothetical protein
VGFCDSGGWQRDANCLWDLLAAGLRMVAKQGGNPRIVVTAIALLMLA